MIYAVVNNKGGAGKSTIAFNCLTAILDNFKLVEIDNNNNTTASFTKSEKLNGKVKSVKISQGFEAFDEALFEMMKDKTCDIIIDAGGGDDSIAVIKLLLREADHNELVFVIPLMTGSGQVNNALDTYELVKDHKVVFVLNASSAKEDFVFWNGSKDYELGGVDPKISNVPTAFIRRTDLFDLAGLEKEVIADTASTAYLYSSTKEANDDLFQMAKGDMNEYKRLKGRHRIAVDCRDFIENDLLEFKKVITSATTSTPKSNILTQSVKKPL